MTTELDRAIDRAKKYEAVANTTAVNAFIDTRQEVLDLLAALTRKVEDHCDLDPDAVHWGHVGDLGRMREQLREMSGDE